MRRAGSNLPATSSAAAVVTNVPPAVVAFNAEVVGVFNAVAVEGVVAEAGVAGDDMLES